MYIFSKILEGRWETTRVQRTSSMQLHAPSSAPYLLRELKSKIQTKNILNRSVSFRRITASGQVGRISDVHFRAANDSCPGVHTRGLIAGEVSRLLDREVSWLASRFLGWLVSWEVCWFISRLLAWLDAGQVCGLLDREICGLVSWILSQPRLS